MDPAPRLRDPSQRVSPRARLMWLVGGLVRAAVLMAALLVTSLVFDWYELRWWMPVLLAVVTLLAAVTIPQWRYTVHRWEVTDTAVYTQTGWWVRERRIAPMSRIQTVDHVEGAIARTLTGDIYRADDRAINSVNREIFSQQTTLAERIRAIRPQVVLAPQPGEAVG